MVKTYIWNIPNTDRNQINDTDVMVIFILFILFLLFCYRPTDICALVVVVIFVHMG